MRPTGQGVVELQRWPAEPPSPDRPSENRFSQAVHRLCGGKLSRGWARRYARWILAASRQFQVDPFTIAGLIYDQSRCRARHFDKYGIGLAAIDYRMHRPHIRRRQYRYLVRGDDGTWQQRRLRLGRYRFYPAVLRRPQANIHFAAALLRVYSEQCPAIDGAFGSVPHRSPVSHLVWGDRVRDAAYEDEILWARRRMIDYYTASRPAVCGTLGVGVALRSPLDGAPLKVLSGWGEERAGGRRAHKGIDLFGPLNAPVYAVADGVVSFAGVGLKRGQRRRACNMAPYQARRVWRRRLAIAGRFVMIRHAHDWHSAYMHLAAYSVKKGQRVVAGDIIGRVGATGVKVSRPHLHFELRKGLRGHVDPLPLLEACVLPPEATYIGRWRRAREGLGVTEAGAESEPRVPRLNWKTKDRGM